MIITYAHASHPEEAVCYNENKLNKSLSEIPEHKKEDLNVQNWNAPSATLLLKNMPSSTAGEHIAFFKMTRMGNLNPKLKNCITHFKVALHPEDKFTNRDLRECSGKILKEMGYVDTPYLVYRHFDEPHPHLHIVASRIKADGQIVSDKHLGYKLRVLADELEEKFDFKKARQLGGEESGVKKENWYLRSLMELTSRKSPRQYVKDAYTESLINRPSLKVFLERLERRNVSANIKPFESSDEPGVKKIGLSYGIISDNPKYSIKNREDMEVRLGGKLTPGEKESLQRNSYFHVENNDKILAIGYNDRGEVKISDDEFAPALPKGEYSVRANKLGNLFQWGNLKDKLDNASVEEAINYSLSNEESLIKEEPAGLTKLIVSAENSYLHGIEEAYQEGYRFKDIPNELRDYLPEITLNSAYIEKMANNYSMVYRNPNEATEALLGHLQGRKWNDIDLLLDPDLYDSYRDRPDTRILSELSVDIMPSDLQEMVHIWNLDLERASADNDELLPAYLKEKEKENKLLCRQLDEAIKSFNYDHAGRIADQMKEIKYMDTANLGFIRDIPELLNKIIGKIPGYSDEEQIPEKPQNPAASGGGKSEKVNKTNQIGENQNNQNRIPPESIT